jgi:hypothetical protein
MNSINAPVNTTPWGVGNFSDMTAMLASKLVFFPVVINALSDELPKVFVILCLISGII